jgi:hypothetical protein
VCVFLAGQLIDMFKNVEKLKEEVSRTTGISNTSIDKLLAIPIPDNRAEVRSHDLSLEAVCRRLAAFSIY